MRKRFVISSLIARSNGEQEQKVSKMLLLRFYLQKLLVKQKHKHLLFIKHCFLYSFKQKFSEEFQNSEAFRRISQDQSYPVSGQHHKWSTQHSPVVWSPSSVANQPLQRCQKGETRLWYILYSFYVSSKQ